MNLPEVSIAVIESIYAILLDMEVDLDPDPLQFGPKRLNKKVAQARGMLTECESLYLKVSMWLQKYRSTNRTLELELDIQKKHLFANDPEVRAGRNVADREALATMRLQDQVREIARVSKAQENLEYLITAIKSKKADLKDIQGRLRDQIKLCQEEIGLGQRWGSKPAPGTEAPDLDAAPNVDRQSLKDLHEMFTGTGVIDPDLASAVSITDASDTEASDEPQVLDEGSGLEEGEVDDLLSSIGPSASESDNASSSIEDILAGLDI